MRIARGLHARQTDPSPAATVSGGDTDVEANSVTSSSRASSATSRTSSTTSPTTGPNNAAGTATRLLLPITPTPVPTSTITETPYLETSATSTFTYYASSTISGSTSQQSSSGRGNVALIAVVSVLAPLCVIGVLLAYLTQRRRRRKIGRLMHLKESRAPSPDDDIFPVHFKSETADSPAGASMSAQRAEKLAIRTHDLESTDGLLTADRSSADLTPTQTQPTSVLTATSAGSAQVERQFQASLEARARKMGIQPHQLLMLLTTSLDQQTTGMSDVASSSDASSDRAFSVVSSSGRTFSLASVPPPAYDHPPRIHLHDLK